MELQHQQQEHGLRDKEETSDMSEPFLETRAPFGAENNPSPSLDDNASQHSQLWNVFGEKIPRSEVVYFCQVTIIAIVIISCIINLSLQNGNSEMWVSFFGYAFGALLPPPKMKTLSNKMLATSQHNMTGAKQRRLTHPV